MSCFYSIDFLEFYENLNIYLFIYTQVTIWIKIAKQICKLKDFHPTSFFFN